MLQSKLLLSQGNKINCLRGWGGGGDYLLAEVLGFSGVNFCLGIRLQEVTFVTHKVFGDFLK